MVGPRRAARKSPRREQGSRFVLTRAALIRMGLLALVAVLGCGAVPGPTDPAPSQAGCAGEPAKGNRGPVCHNGEFTGRYHEGLPVYAFPTIYVVGHRTAD
jgi:hypothetical protein